jgi:hypothetical protein
MLSSRIRVAAGVLAVAVSAVMLTMPAVAQGPSNDNQVWGVWVHRVHIPAGGTIVALVTNHFDGTATASGGFMYGGRPGATTQQSPIHNIWEKTGPRTIARTSLLFTFDLAGLLTGFQRNRSRVEFSQDFNSYKGIEFMETLACPTPLTCPDPLDPTATWIPLPTMPPSGFEVSGKRSIIVPSGPLVP